MENQKKAALGFEFLELSCPNCSKVNPVKMALFDNRKYAFLNVLLENTKFEQNGDYTFFGQHECECDKIIIASVAVYGYSIKAAEQLLKMEEKIKKEKTFTPVETVLEFSCPRCSNMTSAKLAKFGWDDYPSFNDLVAGATGGDDGPYALLGKKICGCGQFICATLAVSSHYREVFEMFFKTNY
ncbi:MAG: hypothetical protein FWG66_06290 [Spirochaetes bacterium]|nr:hypothetical protein [Spirochaetota bacterium]